MRSRMVIAVTVLIAFSVLMSVLDSHSLLIANAATSPPSAAGEYSKHFGALAKLSISVAQTMPPDQYGFRPHPESMNFGELMSHIASTNYSFCAGLKDTDPPALPSPNSTDKDAIVKFFEQFF